MTRLTLDAWDLTKPRPVLGSASGYDLAEGPRRNATWVVMPEYFEMIKPTWISFGGMAGIVTSMALVSGLDAANAGRAAMVSALLIAAVADNLTDSLSVQLYQESVRLEQTKAFSVTLANFATRLVICLSFVLIVALFRRNEAAVGAVVWGMSLLIALTYMVARYRKVRAMPEVAKHLAIALMVIFVSKGIGHWITAHVS